MNYITKIARYLVGTLFIFSGLVKANDPIGFSYKLQEYFEEFEKLKVYFSPLEGFFKLLHDLSLEQAIFMVILEIVLGIAIISGYLPKLTAWLLLLLILFFTVLTFASAQYEIVRSCGCFGDAIPLTPWESFYKDIILLTLILFIFTQKNKIESNKVDLLDIVMAVLCIGALGWLSFSLLKWPFPFIVGVVLIGGYVIWGYIAPKQNVAMYKTLIGLIISGYFTYRCYAHLPAKDFRAYAIGKSIPEQMQGIPDKVQYHYLLSNKATGKQQEFTAFPPNYEAEWNYDTLRIEVFLLIYYDLDKACNSKQTEINAFAEKAKKEGFNFNGLTASIGKTQEDFVVKNKPAYEFWVCDQVVLKTIIRSNPGLVLLKDGVVLGQWHHNDFPEYEKVKEKLLK
jgi:uncharacterized membrane protein YphA (DoxX/SURF4 family)